MTGLRTITVRQPSASLIAAGAKTIETRGWSTKHRGPIAIHAGATDRALLDLRQQANMHRPEAIHVENVLWEWLLDDIKPATERCPACWACDHCGAVDFVPWPEAPRHDMCRACGHVCMHPPCSVCDGAGRCDPIPARGRQGLWRWTPGAPS